MVSKIARRIRRKGGGRMNGHDWDNQPLAHEVPYWMRHKYDNALMIIARNEAEVTVMRKALNLASDFGAHLWWCVECNKAGWAHDMCEHISPKEEEE